MKIIKRNKTEVDFDINKIVVAVTKANNASKETERMTPTQIQRIADSVQKSCETMNRALSVEEIQDLVEKQIMAHGAYEVAKRYITYRYTRSLVRRSNTTDDSILTLAEKPEGMKRNSRLTLAVLPQEGSPFYTVRFGKKRYDIPRDACAQKEGGR